MSTSLDSVGMVFKLTLVPASFRTQQMYLHSPAFGRRKCQFSMSQSLDLVNLKFTLCSFAVGLRLNEPLVVARRWREVDAKLRL